MYWTLDMKELLAYWSTIFFLLKKTKKKVQDGLMEHFALGKPKKIRLYPLPSEGIKI